MRRILCLLLAAVLLTSCLLVSVSAAEATAGEIIENPVESGLMQLNGKWYFRFSDGTYYDQGWLELSEGVFYFTADGSAKTGWMQIGSVWYYFHPDTAKMATDFVDIGGKTYGFASDGRMMTGWIQWKPYSYMEIYRYFYAGPDGALKKGWQQLDGVWRYFYQDGHMAVDTHIGVYYINASGVWSSTERENPIRDYYVGHTAQEAAQADAIAKSIAREALKNGGKTDYEKIKYAAKQVDGYIRKNQTVNGPQDDTPYSLFVSCQNSSSKAEMMAMGRVLDFMDYSWQENSYAFQSFWWLSLKMDGEYGYVVPMNGKVGFGNRNQDPPYAYDYKANQLKHAQGRWIQKGSNWYFADQNGTLQTGWKFINGQWYYFRQDGSMKTGWLQDGSKWYYLTASGAMKTGWLQSGTDWYFLQKDGAMATGMFRTFGDYYFADQNGVMKTGWIYSGGKWRYADQSGALARGRKTVGGVDYYFNEQGEMAVGWVQKANGDWYYGASSGALYKNGWKKIGGSDYYFYKDGHMAARTFIDNYYVNDNGAWESTVSVNRDPQHYKHLTSQQAAQADAIAKSIAQDALKNGGDTDLEKITYASQKVYECVEQCEYENDVNYYYRSPYGVFVERVFTCAGSTRAMGRVLEFMGYKWYHPGENQWDHQWVCVKMDGEYGWVEPQLGTAGYGNFMDNYNPYQ